MITKQQRKALLFIEAEMERSGVAPTLSELAGHLRYRSKPAALKVLVGLEKRGCIRRNRYERRAVEVVRPVSRFEVFKFDPSTKSLRRAK
jgi:SOS-response transcriptional repressor LexA